MNLSRIIALFLMMMPLTSHGQEPAKPKSELEGDWIVVSVDAIGSVASIFGQIPEPDKFKTATFTNDQFTLKVDRHSTRAMYKLDPTASPKTLDMTFRMGSQKATLPGIYDLTGNTLSLCFDNFGETRPTEIPKQPQRKTGVIVLRRKGSDPKLDALDQARATSARNLLALALVMEMSVLDERKYPAAAIFANDGKPLLSWRVALLEQMDLELFKEFKLDEPWDSEHNKKLIPRMPKLYALPGVETKEPEMTFYRVFTGKDTIFDGQQRLSFEKHLGSGGVHLLIVEAADPVIWTKPDELDYDPAKPLPKLGRLSNLGFLATSTSNGPDRVQFVPKSTTEEELRAMIQWRNVKKP
jgi:uncharacterized protein (TIGR03067 family)